MALAKAVPQYWSSMSSPSVTFQSPRAGGSSPTSAAWQSSGRPCREGQRWRAGQEAAGCVGVRLARSAACQAAASGNSWRQQQAAILRQAGRQMSGNCIAGRGAPRRTPGRPLGRPPQRSCPGTQPPPRTHPSCPAAAEEGAPGQAAKAAHRGAASDCLAEWPAGVCSSAALILAAAAWL